MDVHDVRALRKEKNKALVWLGSGGLQGDNAFLE